MQKSKKTDVDGVELAVKEHLERHNKGRPINKIIITDIQTDGVLVFEREKQLKKWKRAWKIRLIEEHNHSWNDLYDEICGLLTSQE